MPYLEETSQSDHASDSVWRAPPVHYGKVITHSSIVSEMAKAPTFRQTLFVSCMPNVIL